MQYKSLYTTYGDALTLSSRVTIETKMVLEHLLEMAEQPEAQRVSLRWTIIKAHVHLALVLAQLGNDDTAQRE